MKKWPLHFMFFISLSSSELLFFCHDMFALTCGGELLPKYFIFSFCCVWLRPDSSERRGDQDCLLSMLSVGTHHGDRLAPEIWIRSRGNNSLLRASRQQKSIEVTAHIGPAGRGIGIIDHSAPFPPSQTHPTSFACMLYIFIC